MQTDNILLLPYHGHAPYLIGAEIALQLGCKCVCIPYYYRQNEVQKRILIEELGGDGDKIYLSPDLGDLFKPLIRDISDPRNFVDYASDLVSSRGVNSATAISNRFANLLEKGFEATTIYGETRSFKEDSFSIILNLGLPVFNKIGVNYYIFSGRMSRIYQSEPYGHKAPVQEIKALGLLWEAIEATFDAMFIPKINPLSHLNIVDQNVMPTPPLSRKYPPLKGLCRESILLVPSGTGLDRKKLWKISKSIPPQYEKVVLEDASEELQIKKKVKSTIYGDKKLAAVISRGGWGTNWKCLVNSKPIGVLDTPYNADPEIAHTIKTLVDLGIGYKLEKSASSFLTSQTISAIRETIRATINSSKTEFSTVDGNNYTRDGISFLISKIYSMIR